MLHMADSALNLTSFMQFGSLAFRTLLAHHDSNDVPDIKVGDKLRCCGEEATSIESRSESYTSMTHPAVQTGRLGLTDFLATIGLRIPR